jgi:hypothetical protein
MISDAAGQVYLTGRFEETADFDPGRGKFELTSKGTTDTYILKITQETSGINDQILTSRLVFPNPTTGLVHIAPSGSMEPSLITVRDIQGKLIREFIDQFGTELTLDLSDQVNGLYLVEITGSKGLSRIKIIKQ